MFQFRLHLVVRQGRELHVIPFLGEDMLDFPMFRKKSTLLRVMVCDDFQKHAYQPVVGFAQLGCQFLGVHVLEVESRLLGLENLRVEVENLLLDAVDGRADGEPRDERGRQVAQERQESYGEITLVVVLQIVDDGWIFPELVRV